MIVERFVVDIITFTAMTFIFIIQILSFCHHSAARISKYALFIVLFAMFVLILYRVSSILFSHQCHSGNLCSWTHRVALSTYSISRVFVYLFYIHRAKLSQGLQPVFSQRYFTQIFPAIIWSIFFIFVLVAIWGTLTHSDVGPWRCDDDGCCIRETAESVGPRHYIFLTVFIVMELTLTLFFLYLFVKPLRNIQVHGRFGDEQILQRMVRINVICTFIGMLSSNITEILFIVDVDWGGVYSFYALNAWINTLMIFLMLKRNRDFFTKYFCCKVQSPSLMRKLSFGVSVAEVTRRIRQSKISMSVKREPSMISMKSLSALSPPGLSVGDTM